MAEAEQEAARIVNAARAHAVAIIEEAQRAPSLPPDEARRLQEALQLFSRTNSDLMRELRLLSDALVPRENPALAEAHRGAAFEEAAHRAALAEAARDAALEEATYRSRSDF